MKTIELFRQLLSNIEAVIISLYDDMQNRIFRDVDFNAIIGLVPLWMRDAGNSQESCMSKEQFEKLVKVNCNRLTNMLLYNFDCEKLVGATQIKFDMVAKLVEMLFEELDDVSNDDIASAKNVVLGMDYASTRMHSIINSIFINLASLCDYLTKLCVEFKEIDTVTYEKYPKMNSRNILFDDRNIIDEQLKGDDTIFSASSSIKPIIKKVLNFRNEVVHNGALDYHCAVYYGDIKGKQKVWIQSPQFTNEGNLSTYCNRKFFYPTESGILNETIFDIIIPYIELCYNTLTKIHYIYYCDRYENPDDIMKYSTIISNWSKTFMDILNNNK